MTLVQGLSQVFRSGLGFCSVCFTLSLVSSQIFYGLRLSNMHLSSSLLRDGQNIGSPDTLVKVAVASARAVVVPRV